jgi:hypothetical protein
MSGPADANAPFGGGAFVIGAGVAPFAGPVLDEAPLMLTPVPAATAQTTTADARVVTR